MSDDETVKVKVGMAVNYVKDSTREDEVDTGYTRTEWDAMSNEERDEAMQPHIDEHVADHLEAWWTEVEED